MRNAVIVITILIAVACDHGDTHALRITRLAALADGEDVFAYARISPDGLYLAYAAETRRADGTRGVDRTIKVLDLRKHRVVFSEPGIDAYFSNDGGRMIFLSLIDPRNPSVSIRNVHSGAIMRNVVRNDLGDYYSWGVRDGRNIILTIKGHYFLLDGDTASLAHARVLPCPHIGTGDRPLLSKDGKRVSVFFNGNVVIRNIDNCDDMLDTGLEGAKADFSFDGNFLAMHVPKAIGVGYDVVVVDLARRTQRLITGKLTGSSLFPSWTYDGRLSFRYDGPDFQGFMVASNVLSVAPYPLPSSAKRQVSIAWSDVFGDTPLPLERKVLVTVWGAWGAHSEDALRDLQLARRHFDEQGLMVATLVATDPASKELDVARIVRSSDFSLSRVPLSATSLRLTGLQNQNPANILFLDGRLVASRLGAQTVKELIDWVAEY